MLSVSDCGSEICFCVIGNVRATLVVEQNLKVNLTLKKSACHLLRLGHGCACEIVIAATKEVFVPK